MCTHTFPLACPLTHTHMHACMHTLSSAIKSSKASGGAHKSKLKEPSYQQVLGKGGGLLRVSTGLASPLCPRVVVVCGRKTTAGEVVQMALGRCGRGDLDHRM